MSMSELGLSNPALCALNDVLEERDRQNKKWGEQNHDVFLWLTILSEEVGEYSEACLHKKFGGEHAEDIHKEMTHVAAVALQALECFHRKGGPQL